jgi:alpha-beta hydrolase superfamily lysophospholipase
MPLRPIIANASRAALALALPLLGSQCGTCPEPGPTAAQLGKRLRGMETGMVKTLDGKDLAYIVHRPSVPARRRAAFLYLHGIESHAGWFDHAAGLLARSGYPVFSLDRRGSGINRENRGFQSGHVGRGTRLVDDVHQAVQMLKTRDRYHKVYLVGLSWGGKYAMAYDATHPGEVDGMILITPGMKPTVDLKTHEKLAVFSDIVFAPRRMHRTPIEPEMFTTDPGFLDYIVNDPFRLKKVSASFLSQSIQMDRLIDKPDDEQRPPMLLFLAGHDRIIDNRATRELVTRNPRRPVTVIDYPDQTHSIQLDAPERLTRDIVRWVKALPEAN